MIHLYVEGGGPTRESSSACREGFRKLLERAGLERMPRIVACGPRRSAYERFSTSLRDPDQSAILLVDSEDAVSNLDPWQHVLHRPGDAWTKPAGAVSNQLHFMVECMENWFLADLGSVRAFFGAEWHAAHIPGNQNIESVSKKHVLDSLESATRHCERGKYHKGRHSFLLLGQLDPALIRARSSWADRFFTEMAKIC